MTKAISINQTLFLPVTLHVKHREHERNAITDEPWRHSSRVNIQNSLNVDKHVPCVHERMSFTKLFHSNIFGIYMYRPTTISNRNIYIPCNIQTSSLKPFGQSKPNFIRSIYRKGVQCVYKNRSYMTIYMVKT